MNIHDVAKEAGVSKSTVSLVVNGSSQISPSTATRVRTAMAKIGYEPRPIGKRGGRRKKIATSLEIAFISVNASSAIFDPVRAPYYVNMLEGIEAACRRAGHTLTILHPREETDREALRTCKANGFLIFGGEGDKEIETTLATNPCVSVFGPRRSRHFGDWVSYDDILVGELAAQHLSHKGCRTIASLGGPPFTRSTSALQHATALGLNIVKMPGKKSFIRDGQVHRPVIRKAIEFLQSKGVDGLFLPSDRLVNVFHPVLIEMGIQPGQDIHLVGCNNAEAFRFNLNPCPATIDIRPFDVGDLAIKQLIYRIQNPNSPAVSTLLVPELIPDQE